MKRLTEYSTPDKRLKALASRPNDALKLIFIWVKQGDIDFREFEKLVISFANKTDAFADAADED